MDFDVQYSNYLSYRIQYVAFNNYSSEPGICGVPQGSILISPLFILNLTDIKYTSNVLDFILFADDTTILYSHKEINSKIDVVNKVLDEVTKWFKASKLSVNVSKTNFTIMTSTKTREDVNVLLAITALERVKFTKFLGVLIDECLTSKNHIDCISKTISRNIGVINNLLFL